MTDTKISQNTDLSSWGTLYIAYFVQTFFVGYITTFQRQEVDKWWIMKDLEGNNRVLNEVLSRNFALRKWEERRCTLVAIVGV
jgi:hypothetical protein